MRKENKHMKTAILIPARYASTRFPGKPLAMLAGKTVIQRVIEACRQVTEATFVATDDERIFNAVAALGYKAIMTASTHQSGTDRIEEAAATLGGDIDVIVNVQGDEPFINPEHIRALIRAFDDKEVEIATLATPCTEGEEANPNNVNVVTSLGGDALYFSRSMIPYFREQGDKGTACCLKHVGVYAYRRQTLSAITRLAPSPLENAERLEQLRWLQNGFGIRVIEVEATAIGIDTPEDLELAEAMLKQGRRGCEAALRQD